MKNDTKVIDRGFKKVFKQLEEMRKQPYVKVGIPVEGNKTEAAPNGIANIDIGFINEFGNPDQGIPERSHFRAAYDKHLQELKVMSDKLLSQVIIGKKSVEQAMGLIGVQKVANIQNLIRGGLEPALKGRSGTPLLDTGQYVASISYKVTDKK